MCIYTQNNKLMNLGHSYKIFDKKNNPLLLSVNCKDILNDIPCVNKYINKNIFTFELMNESLTKYVNQNDIKTKFINKKCHTTQCEKKYVILQLHKNDKFNERIKETLKKKTLVFYQSHIVKGKNVKHFLSEHHTPSKIKSLKRKNVKHFLSEHHTPSKIKSLNSPIKKIKSFYQPMKEIKLF